VTALFQADAGVIHSFISIQP